ncbi:MAG: O-antigen ligase family protein, partial [Gemmatimonadota bacterium]
WIRRGAQLSVALLIGLVLLTQSRGGLLALALFGLVIGLKSLSSRRRVQSLVVIAFLAVGALIAAPQNAIDRMADLKKAIVDRDLYEADQNRSAVQRYTIWKVARQIYREHPLFGVGLGAYPQENAKVAGRSHTMQLAGGERSSHSTYLSVLAETGLPGLLLFLGMILHTLLRSRAARKRATGRAPDLARQLWLVEAAFLAYLAAGVFGTYGQLSFLYIQLALLAAVSCLLGATARLPDPFTGRRLPHATRQLSARRLSRA